jgi:hypothetical protein
MGMAIMSRIFTTSGIGDTFSRPDRQIVIDGMGRRHSRPLREDS